MTRKEQLQQILRAVAHAYQAFSGSFEKGKNCDQLWQPFANTLSKELGEYDIEYDFVWGSDSLKIGGVSTNYIPQDGDSVIIDISVKKNGLWCDVCRTYFVGDVSAGQKHTYEMICNSIREGERVLRAGVGADEMYQAVNAVYEADGKRLIHHAGHQIGDGPVMEPRFLLENHERIEPDSIYTIESGCYEGFGIRLENDYYVGQDGAENMFEDLMSLNVEEYILR